MTQVIEQPHVTEQDILTAQNIVDRAYAKGRITARARLASEIDSIRQINLRRMHVGTVKTGPNQWGYRD